MNVISYSYTGAMEQPVAQGFSLSRLHSTEDEQSVILNTIATCGVKVTWTCVTLNSIAI